MATTFTFIDNQYGDYNATGGLISTVAGDEFGAFSGSVDITAIEAADTDTPNNFALASVGDQFTLTFDVGGTITGEVVRSDNDADSQTGGGGEDLIIFEIIPTQTDPQYIVLNTSGALSQDLFAVGDQSLPPDTVLICFARGTRIRAARGMAPIETLVEGDFVATQDNALRQIKWIGSSTVAVDERTAPVRFKAGALGNERDLLVSPQHRMLVSEWRAQVMFGKDEVLVMAKDMVNGDTIYRDTSMEEVEYFHMLFDEHEIIFAEGVSTESLNPGKAALEGFAEETREELFRLFPELRDMPENGIGPDARPSLKSHEVKALYQAA